MSWWKAAGINYIRYSQVTSGVVRKIVKPDLRKAAAERGELNISIKKKAAE